MDRDSFDADCFPASSSSDVVSVFCLIGSELYLFSIAARSSSNLTILLTGSDCVWYVVDIGCADADLVFLIASTGQHSGGTLKSLTNIIIRQINRDVYFS